MNILNLSWKNLTYKPLSMLLSVLLFSLGIGLISLLFLIENQLQKNFEKNLAGIDLVVGAKGSPLQLILNSMYHIDAPTGNISLKEAKPFLNPKHPLIEQTIPISLGDNFKGYRIIGTTSDILSLYDASIAEGKIWERNFEVTIGASIAIELGVGLGYEFKSSHGFINDEDQIHDDAQSFKVVGILEPTGSVVDQLVLTTTQSFWLVHEHPENESHEEETHEGTSYHDDKTTHKDHKTDESHEHKVEHSHNRHNSELNAIPKPLLEEADEEEITSLLVKFRGRNFQSLNMQRNINENTDMQAATPAVEINRLYSLMNTGEQVLRILAIVIIFVSGLSVFISLYSSLKDRKYELALMRVMGATPSKLFFLIIAEGILLAFTGFLIGIVLSHVGMQLFAGAMKEAYRYTFSGWQFLNQEWYLFLGALSIGFLAAVLPAIQASRTDISETLTQS
ncbi:MAG: FtsX-like permease family protein [Bacteroidota bacterium]